MDIEELNAMIPSETVRNYILETGWVFTDKEKAALLFHNNLPLQEQYSYLRDLSAKTADKELREQITEYLDCKEQGFQAFKENENKNHIYVLRVKAEEENQYYQIQPEGYFFDWKLAYECGKKKGQPFQLQKCVVCDVANKVMMIIIPPSLIFSLTRTARRSAFGAEKFPLMQRKTVILRMFSMRFLIRLSKEILSSRQGRKTMALWKTLRNSGRRHWPDTNRMNGKVLARIIPMSRYV